MAALGFSPRRRLRLTDACRSNAPRRSIDGSSISLAKPLVDCHPSVEVVNRNAICATSRSDPSLRDNSCHTVRHANDHPGDAVVDGRLATLSRPAAASDSRIRLAVVPGQAYAGADSTYRLRRRANVYVLRAVCEKGRVPML